MFIITGMDSKVKYEYVSMNALDNLIASPSIDEIDKKKLKAYKKQYSVKQGAFRVEYGFGKNSPEFGRVYPRGVGLSNLPKAIRGVLATNYVDCDMVSAHFTILQSKFKEFNIADDDLLTDYLTDKKATAMKYGFDGSDELKNEMMYVLNYSKYRTDKEPLQQLNTKIYATLLPVIKGLEKYKVLEKLIHGTKKVYNPWENNGFSKDNKDGVLLAYYLQETEREIVEIIVKHLMKNGIEIDTYIHDGFLIRNDTIPTEQLLNETYDLVYDETNVKIQLKYKPFDTSLVVVPGNIPTSNMLTIDTFKYILDAVPGDIPKELLDLLVAMCQNGIQQESDIVSLLESRIKGFSKDAPHKYYSMNKVIDILKKYNITDRIIVCAVSMYFVSPLDDYSTSLIVKFLFPYKFFYNQKWFINFRGVYSEYEDAIIHKVFEDKLLDDLYSVSKYNIDSMKIISNFGKNNGFRSIVDRLKILMVDHGDKRLTKMDMDYNLLGFEDGVYDLSTGTFYEGTNDFDVSKSVGYRYADVVSAECDETFHNFIDSLFESKDMRDHEINRIAKSLSGAWDERADVICGVGSNTKGTQMTLCGHTLGEYYKNMDGSALAFQRKEGGGASPHLMSLKGVRLCYINEPNEKEAINSTELKKLTSRETISARGLYQDEQQVLISTAMVITLNGSARLSLIDTAIKRRIHIIPYNLEFVEPDRYNSDNPYHREINHSLKNEIPNMKHKFMKLLLQTYQAKLPLIEPDIIKNATLNFFSETDPIVEFCDEFITINKNGHITYADFKQLIEMDKVKMLRVASNLNLKHKTTSDVKAVYSSIARSLDTVIQTTKTINKKTKRDVITGFSFKPEYFTHESERLEHVFQESNQPTIEYAEISEDEPDN